MTTKRDAALAMRVAAAKVCDGYAGIYQREILADIAQRFAAAIRALPLPEAEKEIAAKDAALDDLRRTLRHQAEELSRKEATIAQQAEELAVRYQRNAELCLALEQQAERVKELEIDLAETTQAENFLEKQLATANALIASKDALIEKKDERIQKAKELLDWVKTFVSCAINQSILDELAAIERHQKGEK